MHKRNILSTLLLGGLLLTSLAACKKSNNIGQDNDSVISTPHTVLAGTDQGWIVKTNDGKSFNGIFPSDGRAIEMISAAGPNILILKSQLFLSDNGGTNFNPITYNKYNKKSWRNWVMDCPAHKRVYMASNEGNGVAYSSDSGRTWINDANWQANTSPSIRMTSFGQFVSGAVFAFNDEYNALFRRDGVDGAWNAVTIQGVFPSPSAYFLVTNAADLYIVDYNGLGGAWFSSNEGTTWTKFGQGMLPNAGVEKMVGASSGATGTIAVATNKDVYFASKDRSFEKANTGLDIGTEVYGITSKYNVYKNGNWINFLYLATSKGMYRSDDNGYTWDKVSFDSFNKPYTAIY